MTQCRLQVPCQDRIMPPTKPLSSGIPNTRTNFTLDAKYIRKEIVLFKLVCIASEHAKSALPIFKFNDFKNVFNTLKRLSRITLNSC